MSVSGRYIVVMPSEAWKEAWVCYFACPCCRNIVTACVWDPDTGAGAKCGACGAALRVVRSEKEAEE